MSSVLSAALALPALALVEGVRRHAIESSDLAQLDSVDELGVVELGWAIDFRAAVARGDVTELVFNRACELGIADDLELPKQVGTWRSLSCRLSAVVCSLVGAYMWSSCLPHAKILPCLAVALGAALLTACCAVDALVHEIDRPSLFSGTALLLLGCYLGGIPASSVLLALACSLPVLAVYALGRGFSPAAYGQGDVLVAFCACALVLAQGFGPRLACLLAVALVQGILLFDRDAPARLPLAPVALVPILVAG